MNILFTSVGRRSYLVQYFKETLGDSGEVHVANSSSVSPAFLVADKSVVTPLIYDSEYISFLLEYCKSNHIDAVISLFDIDLPILAKNKERFEEIGTTVIVSDYETIEICNDKWKTFCYLKEKGIDIPVTFISLDDAISSLHNGCVSYPVMVKPRWGMGSIAVFEAENEEELRIFYAKTMRNIQNTYLKYESAVDIEKSILIQEKLKGQEYGLDVIDDLNCNYVTTIAKMKYAMRSGETDCAVTVDKPELKRLGEKLSCVMHHRANLDVDVFVVEDKCYVLEMNARFGGGYPFSHMAGVNLPLAIVKWLNNESVEKSVLTERVNIMGQKDIQMVRLQIEPQMNIGKILDADEAERQFLYFEKFLSPTLLERGIDIKSYAQKICSHGAILSCKNGIENPMGLLGMYVNDKDAYTAYLSFLSVDPNFRGLHVGKEMMKKAEKLALENGMRNFKLEVRKSNINGIAFYKYMGYEVIEEATKDSYYMWKELKEN
ncbi:acetyltransferase (GNAT) family protein [Hungatella effluvii]|uniref:Acetyltransferase (GNAT) family protein n=1 Tax=Hungatella effluvii TaxID=1096246 RepID=A0A2V3Y7A9_9FIRM|nr:acetyltransferase (GNAT) family protein [Hungatella effluvii]